MYNETANETTIAHSREFGSFGKLLTPITDAHAFAFTGRDFDADSDLRYSRNRWFDNSIGKFVSEAPMSFDADDANITRYVFKTPINTSNNLIRRLKTTPQSVMRLIDQSLEPVPSLDVSLLEVAIAGIWSWSCQPTRPKDC